MRREKIIMQLTASSLEKQIKIAKESTSPCKFPLQSMKEMIKLIELTYKYLERKTMDKQINKVKKDLDKGEKDTKSLLKMDKKQDKKMEKCDMKMKKKPAKKKK